jgi:PREDICTED: similar to MGC82677 protein
MRFIIVFLQRLVSSQSQSSGRKGFFSNFIENVRQDISKNKEMKESIKKFREEAQKLEESEALKKARKKFVRLTTLAFFNCNSL